MGGARLRARISTRCLAPAWALAALAGFPGNAFAVWGEEPWGQMVWGSSVLAVPTVGGLGMAALATALLVTAAWTLRRGRPRAGLALMLVVLAIPLGVAAQQTLTVPNTFVDGEVATAEEVNENFDAVKMAVDDSAIGVSAAQGTANTAVTNAAAAQATADAAQATAAAAQVRVSGSCVVGSSIRAIAADGTVTCEAHAAGGAGTTYSAGAGLNLDQAEFSADTTVLQARVSGGCAVGQAISAIAADGTVTCASIESAAAGASEVVVPRFEACPDGVTIADNKNGLLWERKTGTVIPFVNANLCEEQEPAPCSCRGPYLNPSPPPNLLITVPPDQCDTPNQVNNVNNRYTYPGLGSDALPLLNGTSQVPDFSEPYGCFANRCDWRIPSAAEYKTILTGPYAAPGQGNCIPPAPCLDPGFLEAGGDPVADSNSNYWTSTPNGFLRWAVNIASGLFESRVGSTADLYVRFVRTGFCGPDYEESAEAPPGS